MFSISAKKIESGDRGRDVEIEVTITNTGKTALDIQEISLDLPFGVTMQRSFDLDITEVEHRKKNICAKLEYYLNRELIKDGPDGGTHIPRHFKEEMFIGLAKTVTPIVGTGFIMDWITNRVAAQLRDNDQIINVGASADVDLALRAFGRPENDSSMFAQIINYLRGRLEAIEKEEQGADAHSAAYLSRIETEQEIRRSYVLTGKRGWLEPKSYAVVASCTASSTDRGSGPAGERKESVTLTFQVSPKPTMLSLTAMLASVGGVIVKNTVKSDDDGKNSGESAAEPSAAEPSAAEPSVAGPSVAEPSVAESATEPVTVAAWDRFTDWFGSGVAEFSTRMGEFAPLSESLSAIIIAGVFFNVFEYTEYGKKIQMGISWRSALFVGVLCGLLSQQIVKAMTAFIS